MIINPQQSFPRSTAPYKRAPIVKVPRLEVRLRHPNLKVGLSSEERLPTKHLSEDTADAPDVDRVPVLRREHDFRRSVPARYHVLCELRRLLFFRGADPSRKPKIAQLEITVLEHGSNNKRGNGLGVSCTCNTVDTELQLHSRAFIPLRQSIRCEQRQQHHVYSTHGSTSTERTRKQMDKIGPTLHARPFHLIKPYSTLSSTRNTMLTVLSRMFDGFRSRCNTDAE